MSNTIGKLFAVTSFGESHGPCVGTVIDGCPAGLAVSDADIQSELDKRRPASGAGGTARIEADKVEILSGIFNGFTTGAPICLLVWNRDINSSDYEKNRFLPRPGHADFTAFMKYGGFNDYRGGGRFSGRVTAGVVMAGAIAKKLLGWKGVAILAHTVQIGGIKATARDFAEIEKNPLRCADAEAAAAMTQLIEKARAEGDSVGGMIEGLALNVPVGLGEPFFETLDGELARALLSIPAVKGVEFGAGFGVAGMKGSQNNDAFVMKSGKIETATNNAGGVLGGISNGMPIVVRVAVKPTASISQPQDTVDMKEMRAATRAVRGRHDACIVPRAVVVVEAMMSIVLCDFVLRAGLLPGVIK